MTRPTRAAAHRGSTGIARRSHRGGAGASRRAREAGHRDVRRHCEAAKPPKQSRPAAPQVVGGRRTVWPCPFWIASRSLRSRSRWRGRIVARARN